MVAISDDDDMDRGVAACMSNGELPELGGGGEFLRF